jgi:hypothetical protein
MNLFKILIGKSHNGNQEPNFGENLSVSAQNSITPQQSVHDDVCGCEITY